MKSLAKCSTSPRSSAGRNLAEAESARASRHAALAETVHRRGEALRRGAKHGFALDGSYEHAVGDGVLGQAQRSLESRIRAHIGRAGLQVVLTDNRYTMISVRRDRDAGPFYRVRLHHMFADAAPVITKALARYIADNDMASSRLLGDYIDKHQHRVRAARTLTKRVKLHTTGSYHDLQEIFDSLNARCFGGTIEARITWGPRSNKRRRRNSIKMGSYSVEDKLIRLHRSLDRAFVPRFFVEWIVYHEMLHQVHGVRTVGGRRSFHPPEFLRSEEQFEHYDLARHWERDNLDALLTY